MLDKFSSACVGLPCLLRRDWVAGLTCIVVMSCINVGVRKQLRENNHLDSVATPHPGPVIQVSTETLMAYSCILLAYDPHRMESPSSRITPIVMVKHLWAD